MKESAFLFRDIISGADVDELESKTALSFINKGKILNYKDFANVFYHQFGLECDGVIFDDIGSFFDFYNYAVDEINKIIGYTELTTNVVCLLHVMTDSRVKTISITSQHIYSYPSSIPETNNCVYFGEEGNVVKINTKT